MIEVNFDIEKGSVGEVNDVTDGWYNITIGKHTGWISSEYFKAEVVEPTSQTEELESELKNTDLFQNLK